MGDSRSSRRGGGSAGGSRRGREMRGPLLPPTVPGWRSRAERFDMAVLEAYEPIERHWHERLTELGRKWSTWRLRKAKAELGGTGCW